MGQDIKIDFFPIFRTPESQDKNGKHSLTTIKKTMGSAKNQKKHRYSSLDKPPTEDAQMSVCISAF